MTPRILFIDAYDSFANNIVALLQESLDAEVTTVHIDDQTLQEATSHDFFRFLHGFDAVVAGPGPGTVTNSRDIGLIARLWTLPDRQLLPVLGICLGFQSLAHAFGARIERLPEPRHGIITGVRHQGRSIFKHVKEIRATQYHSLQVKLGFSTDARRRVCDLRDMWKPTVQCPELKPLAWDCDSAENGPVLMAVEHSTKPFWGIQYHPESICTNEEGARIIRNWWTESMAWSAGLELEFKAQACRPNGATIQSSSRNGLSPFGNSPRLREIVDQRHRKLLHRNLVNHPDSGMNYRCLAVRECDVRELCELLEIPGQEAVVLESGLKANKEPILAETGSNSIIGCLDSNGGFLRVEYYVRGQVLELWAGKELLDREEGADVWTYLKDLMKRCRIADGPGDSTFWGGLVGFVTYEAGLETINVKTPTDALANGRTDLARPDLMFAFVMRSVVVDHVRHIVRVQSIRDGDAEWVRTTALKLSSSVSCQNGHSAHKLPKCTLPCDLPDAATKHRAQRSADVNAKAKSASSAVSSTKDLGAVLHRSTTTIPSQPAYESQVRSCQESIRAGDSYELCLTSQTTVHVPVTSQAGTDTNTLPWHLYTRLRRLNPAPFGAYMRLGSEKRDRGVNIVCSSPERFLRWSRDGRCQYRPIKGTVRKEPGLTRTDAERILHSAKERAENLMIVDLVRHDLHGVVGAGNVSVSKLMGVEEYETVYQLVSVIEGDLSGGVGRVGNKRKASVPRRENGEGEGARSDGADSDPASLEQSETSSLDSWPTAATNDASPPGPPQPHTRSPPSENPSGIDILHASLPPGSMTGAPKKRSCELLHAIEAGRPRGIYSGVLGYLDVGGAGDFAVVIRTAFRWDGNGDDAEAGDGCEVWSVGAGGAVTAQSTPAGEYDEMRVKLESTLRMFDPDVAGDDAER